MSRAPRLLNPGPVNLTEGVRAALGGQDVCHRELEFAELTLDVRARLERVYADASPGYEALLLTGSGTCAVEAMLASLVPPQGRVLVVANGVYGERMVAMLEAHGRPHAVLSAPWLAAIDLSRVAQRLREGDFTHVATVQNETTTGRLNEIAPLAEVCREHGAALLLDAVSSFGSEAIDFAGWRPAGVAATANKCLHGAPGIAFVLADSAALDAPGAPPALYLDLRRYRAAQREGFSPFTQATHVMAALREALRELEQAGGWQARQSLYRTRSARIRGALASLGVESLLDPAESSCSIGAFELPAGRTYAELHAALKRAGFVIYAGQGQLASSVFRIANMGELSGSDLERLAAACAEFMA